MKKLFASIFSLLCFSFMSAQVLSWQGGQIPEQNQQAVLLFNRAGTPLATTNVIYAHIGVTLNGQAWQNVIGTWGNNTQQPLLTLVSGNTFSLTLSPTIQEFFNVNAGAITRINVVFRNAAGTTQTTDLEINVGGFQSTLTAPTNVNTIIPSGGNLQVTASNTGGNANYVLTANGQTLNTATGVSSFSFNHTNITGNQVYVLTISQGNVTFEHRFNVLVNPGQLTAAMPSGVEDGINYLPNDPTKAILVLDAPHKDFIYVAGSFNNYQPDINYAMRRNPGTTKFWLELSDLTPGEIYTFQYWVVTTNPIPNSPALVKCADPYSHLVLSNFDDPWIPAASFPNLPPYPAGQEREVTVIQTGQTPYPWSDATLNFQKPPIEDLVFYEVLIRDFDQSRTFQDLIDRIDYFVDLKVNAIKIMPVMEFEGNESWGYNTSFHLAIDKFYGPEVKLKEFIDLCHQNGIAVVFDLVLNHVFGRSPLVRMWMNDPEGDGWGPPSTQNPYLNTVAMHSYNVGEDFNHQQERTRYYSKRVLKRFIEDFKIDGFRWDLTKGFTQNCPPGPNQEACTNGFHQDRIDVLREYADYSWLLDPTHYVIFEHLGMDSEEQQWANYRVNEGKGIMLWGKMTDEYNQLTMGFNENANINRMGHLSRGFQAARLLGYAESHDEERIMFRNVQFGNNSNPQHNVRNLNVALSRMPAMGAVSLLIPGPKMIWHFGALGNEMSIFTCQDGTINPRGSGPPGHCRLDTKPQPQWVNDWINIPARRRIYDEWAKMIHMKRSEPVFRSSYSISPDGSNLRQRIYVWNDNIPASQLRNVVIIANFGVTAQNINPSFPYGGTWFNLMDETSFQVTNLTAPINLQPGEYRIFGNQLAVLSNEVVEDVASFQIYPNPTRNEFFVNAPTSSVEVYTLTGQLVKTFKGDFHAAQAFPVNGMQKGIYMVRITDKNNRENTVKLVIQ